jgi:hypothetical protein
MEDPLGLPHDAFTKLDTEDDEIFCEPHRLVYNSAPPGIRAGRSDRFGSTEKLSSIVENLGYW